MRTATRPDLSGLRQQCLLEEHTDICNKEISSLRKSLTCSLIELYCLNEVSCITREQKYVNDFLLQYTKFFADFDEGSDGLVQMFLFVGSR